MNTRSMIIAAVIAAGVLAPSMASADPPCGRGWRKHEWCGGYVYGAPRHVPPPVVYYARPPVVYAPPPVVYAPPPVMYGYPPPMVAPAPGLSIGVNIPLR